MATHEREISEPAALCDEWGRLATEARGWSRHPMLTANLRGARGRKKRWDYWYMWKCRTHKQRMLCYSKHTGELLRRQHNSNLPM